MSKLMARGRCARSSRLGVGKLLGLLVLVISLSPIGVVAQDAGYGPLGDLFLAQEGGIAHYSSYDRSGGNDDFVVIEPGATHTLVDHEGTGIIRRWWLTISPRNNREIQRQLIVRCYWDGEKAPSVEVPVSDFFGMGFGMWKDFTSLPLNMTSGGYNSYWPMPFRRKVRITVENTSNVKIDRFYYNIDVRTREQLPSDVRYFHAQYRQTISKADVPVTILETTGQGHYVGTLLSMAPLTGSSLGYLEGDQRIFIDGSEAPSIIGTGTEDYFSSGWYYDTGEYSAPYHGVSVKNGEDGRINTYRWHIEDPIPFEEELLFTIEHGGDNDAPGVAYSSVAFWYQSHPHLPFPPLPDNLLPLSAMATPEIEGESLMSQARTTGGHLQIQQMASFNDDWGGDAQLWWVEARPGDRLTLQLEAPSTGSYEMVGFFTRAQDYGVIRLHVNDRTLVPLVDGFSRSVSMTGPISFGEVTLHEGSNELVLELIGKSARSGGYSDGYLVGIDGFTLRASAAAAEEE